MNTEKIDFKLVSPEKLFLSEKADMVVVPGDQGDFGVLPDHSALVSNLRPGVVEVYHGDAIAHRVYVSEGFANVNETGCTVLAEECIFVQDLVAEDLETYIRKAREELEIARTEEEKASLRRDLFYAKVKLDIVKQSTEA